MTLCNIKLSDQNDKDKESINKCRRINKAFHGGQDRREERVHYMVFKQCNG